MKTLAKYFGLTVGP